MEVTRRYGGYARGTSPKGWHRRVRSASAAQWEVTSRFLVDDEVGAEGLETAGEILVAAPHRVAHAKER